MDTASKTQTGTMDDVISSQAFRDPAVVQAKRDARDYAVTTITITVGGTTYRVVLDGHHSMDAAELDGAEVEWVDADAGAYAELEYMGVEDYLESRAIDCQYHHVTDDRPVW